VDKENERVLNGAFMLSSVEVFADATMEDSG